MIVFTFHLNGNNKYLFVISLPMYYKQIKYFEYVHDIMGRSIKGLLYLLAISGIFIYSAIYDTIIVIQWDTCSYP